MKIEEKEELNLCREENNVNGCKRKKPTIYYSAKDAIISKC
jgi:hypothetical protein